MKCDILIAGVGGQGTVLASKLIAAAAIKAGYFVRTSETIGMAQRGGSVVSHVRIGSKDSSPVIPLGTADLLIGFEPSEAARNLSRLSPTGNCLINTRPVNPVSAIQGNNSFNLQAVLDFIQDRFPSAVFLDGYEAARTSGSVKTLNVVLTGVAAAKGFLPFGKDIIESAIRENMAPKFVELNIKALNTIF